AGDLFNGKFGDQPLAGALGVVKREPDTVRHFAVAHDGNTGIFRLRLAGAPEDLVQGFLGMRMGVLGEGTSIELFIAESCGLFGMAPDIGLDQGEGLRWVCDRSPAIYKRYGTRYNYGVYNRLGIYIRQGSF